MKDNAQTIKNAFARLSARKDKAISAGMTNFLDEAVQYALYEHDARHQNHLEMGDSYGWKLSRNGREVASEVLGSEPGSAFSSQLRTEAVRTSGWCGVVMAGMLPARYFKTSYELGVLMRTVSWAKRDFPVYIGNQLRFSH